MTRESLNRVKRKLTRLASEGLRRVEGWLAFRDAAHRVHAFEATLNPPLSLESVRRWVWIDVDYGRPIVIGAGE